MNILLFGVGRSGTKAVQLYLSYNMAKNFGNIRINYEPYFWQNRKTNKINYEGLYHHATSPNIATSPDQFSKRHRNFLRELSKSSPNVVTKFIRGNGRIRAIEPLIQPDSTIVIVRDLYEVLTSVLLTNWDFLSVGFEYKIDWESFLQEVRKSGLIENLDWCIDQITDRLDRNAFYWYVMNISAIEYATDDTIFIDYSKLEEIQNAAKIIFNNYYLPKISDPIFNGDNIHGDYPLISSKQRNSASEIINGFLYKSQLTEKYGLFLPSNTTGDIVKLNEGPPPAELPKSKSTKITIDKKDLYEFFNSEVSKRLAAKIEKNRISSGK
jgi:hypothetical protein